MRTTGKPCGAPLVWTQSLRIPRPRPDARSLYSRQALREMRAYLRLRMLELREADLDRVRAVIGRRLSVDDLLEPGETPTGPSR